MRLYSVRLVAAVALFAYVEASALESQPQPTLPETSGHGDSSDQTFPQHGTNTDEEERMNTSNALRGMGGTTGLFKPMRNNLAKNAQQWTEKLKGKSARDAFTFLELDKAVGNVFANSRFLQWEYFDTSAQGEDTYEAMVKVLLDHFGIFRLAEMLDAAKEAGSSTKAIAIKLEDALTSPWQHFNPGIIFDELGLDAKSNRLLGIPLFKTWYKFATEKWSNLEVLMFLESRLNKFGLVKMLEATKKKDRTKAIAVCLEYVYIHHRRRYNPVSTFDNLGLEAKSDDLLGNPLFITWYKYATELWSTLEVVRFLETRFGKDGLDKMLNAAKEVNSTKAIAIELKDAYTSPWKHSKSGIMFDKLGLNAESDDVLRIPIFETWYMHATQEWSPEQVVRFLRARFGDFSFAKMLDAAKEADSTKAIAIQLEDAYILQWQHSNPGIKFDELGLEAKSDELLGIPLFKTWYKFAKKEWSPEQVMKFLETRLDDFSFAKMLDAAKRDESAKATAIELEDAYILLWQHSNPGIKFDELGLDAKSDDLLDNPLFKTWYKFATKKWAKLEVVMFLEARLNEDGLVKMLEAAKKNDRTKEIAIKLTKTLFRGKLNYLPDKTFDNLGLEAKSDDLLGNPLFKTWYKYATKVWLPKEVMRFIKGKSHRFGLAVMLDAATKVGDTEAIATKLLEALFDHWRRSKLSKAEAKKGLLHTQPFLLARRMELGQTVSADDFSVWRKYTEWRRKKGILM